MFILYLYMRLCDARENATAPLKIGRVPRARDRVATRLRHGVRLFMKQYTRVTTTPV